MSRFAGRDDLIAGWLDEVLPGRPRGIEPASEDASFRRYLRVTTPGRSLVVMDAPPALEDSRPFADVAQRLHDAGLNAPEILASDLDRGLLLLSDLGSRDYLRALNAATADGLYGDALRALGTMQRDVSTDGLRDYDEAHVRRELSLFTDWLLVRHLDVALTGAQEQLLQGCFDDLWRCFTEQPQVFVHLDYHSRNLMCLEAGNPGILDFQDAVRGPVTYDLVSLLRDVYVAWPQIRVAAWTRRFLRESTGDGVCQGVDAETFSRWFDLTGAQRHLKIAGIFARLYHRDGKSRYLRDIPLALDYLRQATARHRVLQPLRSLFDEVDLPARVRRRNAEVFR